MSNWEQRLCPCSCCVPIEMNGIEFKEMHRDLYILVWANMALAWVYTVERLYEQGLRCIEKHCVVLLYLPLKFMRLLFLSANVVTWNLSLDLPKFLPWIVLQLYCLPLFCKALCRLLALYKFYILIIKLWVSALQLRVEARLAVKKPGVQVDW